MGLIPQRVKATQLLYRTTDRHGNADAAATTVIVPAERAPQGRHPNPLLPMRDRRRHLAMLSVVCPAAIRAGDRRRRAVRVSARRGRARGGLGGIGTRPRGSHRYVGCAVRARLSRPGWVCAPPSSTQTPGPVSGCADRSLGLLRRRARQRMGRRDERLLCTRTEYRRRGARIARRRPGRRPSAGSTEPSCPGCPRSSLRHSVDVLLPDLNRIIQHHATEEGKALLLRLHGMTTAEAVIRMAKKDMDNMVDVPLEQILDTPEVQARIRRHQTRRRRCPTPPVLIVQAVHDQLDLGREHRRAGRHLPYRAGRR